MSALAAKLVCEARELARQGAVSEARQVLRRALGSLPDGETLAEADELLKKLEPKATADDALVSDFRAYLSGQGDSATEATDPDPEATRQPAVAVAATTPQKPTVDDVFVDEAEQRRRQSARRVRIGAAVAVAVVCIYPIMELIRVWSPPAAEGDTQTTSIAARKPRVAMPQLDFGAGRRPHRYSDAEVRMLFVSSSRNNTRDKHAPTAANTFGMMPRGAEAPFSAPQGSGASRTPAAEPQSGSHRANATANSTATNNATTNNATTNNDQSSQRSQPQEFVLGASSGIDSTDGTINAGNRQPHGHTSETRPSAIGRSRRPRHKSGSAKSSAPAPSRRARGGRYFSPGRLLAVNDAPKDEIEKIKLPIRTKIKAKLDLGITSSRHGMVLAIVQETVGSGRNTVPRGAVLIGTSEDDGKRIYVKFSEVRIAEKPYGIKALATENSYLGLNPQRHESSLEQRQGARVAQGALEVAGDIVRRAAGVASPIVDGVVDEAAAEQTVDRTVTLAIPSGHTFVAKVIE